MQPENTQPGQVFSPTPNPNLNPGPDPEPQVVPPAPLHKSRPPEPAVPTPMVQAPAAMPPSPAPTSMVTTAPPAPEQPSVYMPPKRKSKKPIFIILIVLLLLGVTGGVGAFYKKSQSTKKFNELADQILKQEAAGTESYVTISNATSNINEITAGSNTSDKAVARVTAITRKLEQVINKNCLNKEKDLDSAKIIAQSKGLWLSGEQKRFLDYAKQTLDNIKGTEFSNAGQCRDGQLLVLIYKNLARLIGSSNKLDDVFKRSAPPSDTELNALYTEVTQGLSLSSEFNKTLPATKKVLVDLQDIVENAYYIVEALVKGDMAGFQKHLQRAAQLGTVLSEDTDGADREILVFATKDADNVIKISKAELTGIESLSKTKLGVKLDSAMPAFRIVESTISKYKLKHNSKFPHAKSIDDIAQLDGNMEMLKSKGLLASMTYKSLGPNDSGASLTVKLKNGKTLIEEQKASDELAFSSFAQS